MNNHILIIDDDVELCDLLHKYLSTEGFTVETVHDGEQGSERACSGSFGLVVLDVMLPRLGGFEVLRKIRSSSNLPVIMLTARGDDVDRIVGLEMGADDYLPKPFNPRELVARLRAVQRRAAMKYESRPEIVTVGDITLDPGARSVIAPQGHLELTSVEFSLLEVLLRMAGRVVSRDDLATQALGRSLAYHDRSIDVHVSSLRRKLGPLADGGDRLKSVRGVGYLYVSPAEEQP